MITSYHPAKLRGRIRPWMGGVLLASSLVWLLGGMATAQVRSSVKVANAQEAMDFITIYMGRDKGFFREEKIDLTILVVSAPLAVSALVAGEIDYTSAVGSSLRAAIRGAKVRVVAGIQKNPLWVFMAQPEIKAGKDLKGKTIAISSVGGSDYLATLIGLKYFGIDPDREVSLISTGRSSTTYAALKARSVAAGLLPLPYNVAAEKAGYTRLVVMADILDMPVVGLTTTTKRIEEQPAQVKGMIRALIKSMRHIRGNRLETVHYAVKQWGLDQETAQAAYDLASRVLSMDGSVSPTGIRFHMDVILRQEKMTREIPSSQVTEFSLLREVQREMR